MGTILIVEDNYELNNIYKNVLNFKKTKVVFAENAIKALNEIKKCLPDLILLDTTLPGPKNGEQFLEDLQTKAIWSKIPIIILSNQDKKILSKLKRFPNVVEIILKVELDILKLESKISQFNIQ